MFSFQNAISFITILFSGLIAGLLFSYSCSVNSGLKVLPDGVYLKAMQSINAAIQNPYFFLCFMGLLFLFPVYAWLVYAQQDKTSFYFVLAAAAIYFSGVFAVTVFGNVPLNELLAKFEIASASAADISSMRSDFEAHWNTFHLVRTIAAVISFSLTILTVLKLNTKVV
ncbi:hypothetical protein BH11BAC7_BH11BAC7_06390 [soil metagenome]